MYADISKPPAPLPSSDATSLRPGVTLLPPLSRRGHGPGLIILTPQTPSPMAIVNGVPSLLIKWAEEGFTVVQIEDTALKGQCVAEVLDVAASALLQSAECVPKDKIAIVSYTANLWNLAATSIANIASVVAGVVYADAVDEPSITSTRVPLLCHIHGPSSEPRPKSTNIVKKYSYPKVQSHAFAIPFHSHFHYITESLAHTRNLQFLKPLVGGPYFDLEAIWDEHTHYEFADRSVEHTMSTMVAEPYVNHVPTMTGGVGRDNLSEFYRHNFIFQNSADTELELISRTVGIDRVVDEFIFKFTHDCEVDWLLPGVPATHQKAEVPFTAIVNIRGDRLYHEHISWDQGTVLRQLGLMPEYLPYPHHLPDGKGSSSSTEYRVPVAGIDSANKLRDRLAVPSNAMFEFGTRERESGSS